MKHFFFIFWRKFLIKKHKKTEKNQKKFFRGRPASWKRSPDALNLFPDAISEGFLSSFYCRWNAFKNFAVRLPGRFRGRFSEMRFVSRNRFWIHKSASFYWISWGRACQNWCRIVIFRDRHFPKKCQKIKILKNEISEIFSNFQLKNMKKRRKIKNFFPRPSGELKALAGRAKFIPGCD